MNFLDMTITSAVLIIAIVLIRALFLYKLPKKAFTLLWGVAICRLMIPYDLSSRFSIYIWIDKLRGTASSTNAITGTMDSISVNIIGNGITNNTTQAVTASEQAVFVSPFAVVWLVGMFALGLFFIVAYVRCHKEFNMSLPVDNDFVSKWQSENPMRRKVQIRYSDRIKAARTYGIFRPVILLPKTTNWQDEKVLNYILTHEYMHIKSFDSIKKLILALTVSVHWFNPLVWVMYILANRDIEIACDERVINSLDEATKADYAMALVGLEEKKSGLNPLYSCFSKNSIEERVKSIMKNKKITSIGIATALILVLGVTMVFAMGATKVGSGNSAFAQIFEGKVKYPVTAFIDSGKSIQKLDELLGLEDHIGVNIEIVRYFDETFLSAYRFTQSMPNDILSKYGEDDVQKINEYIEKFYNHHPAKELNDIIQYEIDLISNEKDLQDTYVIIDYFDDWHDFISRTALNEPMSETPVANNKANAGTNSIADEESDELRN